MPDCCNEDDGSAANPHAANSPAVAVPETLSLPDPAAIIVVSDVGWTAIVAVTGPVAGAIAIISRTGKRSADDGAADQSSRDSSRNAAVAGLGGLRDRHGGNSHGGDSRECHQCLFHRLAFHLRRTAIRPSAARKVP